MMVRIRFNGNILQLLTELFLLAPTDYLIATTNIINGESFLQSLSETLSRSKA